VTTLCLDANRYLEELVDGFRPGQDSHRASAYYR
jgi:hypothetical protein